ncbi:MAG: cell wall-binding repeat-containing protein [Coriobacteriales bacterium]|jgi:hypothetical protein
MTDRPTIQASQATASRFLKLPMLLLLILASLLVVGAVALTAPQKAEAATYPTASEVYVSGKPMTEFTGQQASYDPSTGTLMLTGQVFGVSVESTRTNLDLNIVADGSSVQLSGRSRDAHLVADKKLYALSNTTGGNININVTAGTRLSISANLVDDVPDVNRTITEMTCIYCRGHVTLTGEEGSHYGIIALANWTENGETHNNPNVPVTGIRATAGVSIEGAAEGVVQIQNRGVARVPQYCSSAIRVASGAQITIGASGKWNFNTAAAGNKDYPEGYAAVFYVSAGSVLPTVLPQAGTVAFDVGSGDYHYFVLNDNGQSKALTDLPEVDQHVLSISSSGGKYQRDGRTVIDTTTIKLNELPALGTQGSITAENVVLDLGQTPPRYTMKSAAWWYKDSGGDTWHRLASNQYLPADATAVRVGFELEAAEGYRFSYGTDVIARFNTSTSTVVQHTIERKYMHPESIPSNGTFYIDLELSDIADQHPIDEAKVWGVSAPHNRGQAYVVTSQSSSYGQIPSSAIRYYAWADSTQYGTRPGNQYWTEVDPVTNEDTRTLEDGEAFQPGREYRWHGILYAKPGWEFTSDTAVAFNSDNVCGHTIHADGKLLEIYRTWRCPTLSITKVAVLDQTEPVAGEAPVIDATVPDDAAYSITAGSSYWYEGRLNSSQSYQLRELTPFTGTFQADTWYSYVVCLEPDGANGYGFNGYSNEQDIAAMESSVNGASGGDVFGRYFTAGQTGGRGIIMLCRTFYCTNPDAIERIDIDLALPVVGQQASGDATCLTEGVSMVSTADDMRTMLDGWGNTAGANRIPNDAMVVWTSPEAFDDFNPSASAVMPTFANSTTYTLWARIQVDDGYVIARNDMGVLSPRVFVNGVPAQVNLIDEAEQAYSVRLSYSTPVAGNEGHHLFIPRGIVLEREYNGSWMQWSSTVEDYNSSGFDLYDTAAEGTHFRVRAYYPATWKAPAGEEFYQWYSSSSDVVFAFSVRKDYNEFTMPAHDVTIGILTQKKGTLPTELTDWMISSYTASDGWENPESWSWTSFDGNDQYLEAVLVDNKGTSETDDDYPMVKGTDYTVTYEPAVGADAGTYVVTYTGIPGAHNVGGYEGSITTKYKIDSVNIANCDITVNTAYADDPENPGDDPAWWEYYTGSAIEPKVTAKLGDYTLIEGTDYELEYYWNADVGTATVQINGLGGNFTGWTSRHFEIRARDLSESTITPPSDVTFNGGYQEPPVTVTYDGVTLERGTDYYIEYYANYEVGTARVEVTGNKYAGWDGTQEFEFQILPIDLSDPTIEWQELGEQQYTGSEIRFFDTHTYAGNHPVAGSLMRDHDFEVTNYSNNVYPGVATITLTGKGNYIGTHEMSFDIFAYLQNDYITYSGVKDSYPYTGSQIKPEPAVAIDGHELSPSDGYTLVWDTNTAAGESAFVTIVGDNVHYKDSRAISFTITERDIGDCTIAPVSSQNYTGSEIRPPVTITVGGYTLKKDTDYTVEYSDNINMGTATATITAVPGSGFTGSASTTFKIVKPHTVKWDRIYGAVAADTMQKIAAKFGKSNYAIVTTDASFKDALAASSLAGHYKAPVLMTKKGSLTAQTKKAIQASGAKTVIIVGTTSDVTTATQNAIKKVPGVKSTWRVNGKSASEKAVNVAKKTGTKSDTVIIVTQNDYRDALTIAPYAYATESPILYTETNKKLSTATLNYIKQRKFKKAIIIGGPLALPDSVDMSLRSKGGIKKANITRIAGSTAYDTSRLIAEWTTGNLKNGNHGTYKGKPLAYIKFQPTVKFVPNNVCVSTGQNWLDALAGAALCGKWKTVMLLADSKTAKSNSSHAVNFLSKYKDKIDNGWVLGGPKAVQDGVYTKLQNATAPKIYTTGG